MFPSPVSPVTPKSFKRTEPQPYKGHAKFGRVLKPANGSPPHVTYEDVAGQLVVVVDDARPAPMPGVAAQVWATQIGNASTGEDRFPWYGYVLVGLIGIGCLVGLVDGILHWVGR